MINHDTGQSWHTANQTVSDFWKALVRGGIPGARWYLEHKT